MLPRLSHQFVVVLALAVTGCSAKVVKPEAFDKEVLAQNPLGACRA